MDYNARTQSTTTTVEISSNDSSDDEVLVVNDDEPVANSATVIATTNATTVVATTNATTVVLETSGNAEENCVMTDISHQEPVEMEQSVDPLSAVLLESSSDSECEFVLALKPPHLRTPEMLSLDSASDSDVIFIPNGPTVVTRVDSSTTDSEDNKPLAETCKQLKSEAEEEKPVITFKIDESVIPKNESTIPIFNYSASTSAMNEDNGKIRKIYFAPKRKRAATKSIFASSSSSSGSTSSNSNSSSDEANDKDSNKSKSRQKLTAKKLKKIRLSSAIGSTPKPLSQLQSSEEAQNDDDHGLVQPRLKSVIIKKTDNQQYSVQQRTDTSTDSSSCNN